jgi:hypothetical protein
MCGVALAAGRRMNYLSAFVYRIVESAFLRINATAGGLGWPAVARPALMFDPR